MQKELLQETCVITFLHLNGNFLPCDIADATKQNMQLTPKEIQKGIGMDYRPMQVSLAASNIGRIRATVKKGRRDVDKVDQEK